MNGPLRLRGRHASRRMVVFRVPIIVMSLVLLLLGLLPAGVSAAPVGGWVATGGLPIGHSEQPAVVLNNGKVLAVGGQMYTTPAVGNSHYAMLYDPASGTWNATGSLDTGRRGHSVTMLANGKVLVAGGETANGITKSAELYDPATGQWSSAGVMFNKRTRHTAVRLATGKVLVAGGEDSGAWQSAELYDPATNGWSPTGAMISARAGHTAVRLASGKVLVVGGRQGDDALASAELFNPATNSWSSTGNLTVPRYYHAMTLLNNGMVLVTGGFNLLTAESTAATERYDPATGAWTMLPNMQIPRAVHTMTTLPSGDVLVNGGYFAGTTLASAEVYSPVGNSWYLTGGMTGPRLQHTAIVLTNGTVLTFGGYAVNSEQGFEMSLSAELFDPAQAVTTQALQLTTAGPGTTVAYPAGGVYPSGTTVVIRATPDPGEIFLGWTADGATRGWASVRTVTMDGPHAVTANFALTPSFPDVLGGNPAQGAIGQLAARGIIKGYGDGRFGPNDTTLRAQMAALICRAMGWADEDHGNPFTDGGALDAKLWRNVGTLAYYNVGHGYGDGRFGPNDVVTRAQVISFVTRAMVKKGYWQLADDNPIYFPDVPAASGHRRDLITYYYSAGNLPEQQAYDYPFSDWNAPSTRGWFAQVLWKALDDEFGGAMYP